MRGVRELPGRGTHVSAIDPHTAERMILIGCHDAASRAHTLRLFLHPHERDFWLQQSIEFLNDTVKYVTTTCAVFVDSDYEDWPEVQGVVTLTREHYKQANINQNTVEAIGANQGRNFISNLARIIRQPYIYRDACAHLRPSIEGQTVVICGAGPSLERDAPMLNRFAGPIIAVNTSAGCCAQSGLYPLAILCTESKPVTEGIGRMNRDASMFTMDLIGNPANWLSEHDTLLPQLAFAGTEPNLAPYARTLGLLPLAYGSSCTTAAVSLALACGAKRVVLTGQDCAFMTYAYRTEYAGQSALPAADPDDTFIAARMYASGSPYEETTVMINATRKRAAIRKPHVGEFEIDAFMVGGIDQDQPVWTTHSMLSFAHWFRDQPEAVRARIVNASCHGVVIPGIEHAALEDVIEMGAPLLVKSSSRRLAPPPATWGDITPAECVGFGNRAQAVLGHLVYAAEHGLAIQRPADVLEWAQQHSIFGMWTGPARLTMRKRDDMSSAERGEVMAETIRAACRDIIRCGGDTVS